MKLWEKGIDTAANIEAFTVGKDRDLDIYLAPFDVLGTMAHIRMLEKVGLLETDELEQLLKALKEIYKDISEKRFQIEEGVEDVHSQVELQLTRQLGDIGKKVHSGRSRNDQVLVDLKLYFLHEIEQIATAAERLFSLLQQLSEAHKDVLLPGYTHFQVAMPSSFGLWFGAYAEALIDDLHMLLAAWNVANQNPLGSAAGYGSSFPLDREMTTQLLGFDTMSYNVVYAQMGRGKTERVLGYALSAFGSTLNKLASDVCLYMSQNFGFIKFPDALTTGSSIMPHKKNPDVFEIMRGRGNQLQQLPGDIGAITTNLPSGYHRDLQVTKELIIPGIENLKACLEMCHFMLEHIEVMPGLLENEMYNYLFSVEEVNRLVLEGTPFREAYKAVAKSIEGGNFSPNRTMQHSHEGSIGNLCNGEIRLKMNRVLEKFEFNKHQEVLNNLLKG